MRNRIMKGLAIGVILCAVCISSVSAGNGIQSAAFNNFTISLNGKSLPLTHSLASITKEGSKEALTYAPLRELFENLGYQVDWDATDQSIHLSPKVIQSFFEFYEQDFPLMAADYDEQVYIYALGYKQTVVKYKGVTKAFDWYVTTPRFILPRLHVFDFDNDGEKEVALSLNTSSGTGIAIDSLYMIEPYMEADATYSDLIGYEFLAEDYVKQISNVIDYEILRNENTIQARIFCEGIDYSTDITEYLRLVSSDSNDVRLHYGNHISFTPADDNTIKLEAVISVTTDKNIYSYPVMLLEANVIYREHEFSLTNIQIKKE